MYRFINHIYRSPKTCVWHGLVMLSFLFLNIAPTFASVFASQDAYLTMEICSISGHKDQVMVSLGSSESSIELTSESHCQLCCSSFSEDLVLYQPMVFAISTPLVEFPALFYQSPQPLFSWLSAPSRGPPQTSN